MLESPRSSHLGFIDECGSASLARIDPDFPLFLTATLVISRKDYVEQVLPTIGRLKLRFWSHEGVNLHSRDIRKAIGDFSFMLVPEMRRAMHEEINQLMSLDYRLFIAAIDKRQLIARHGDDAPNPYDLALQLSFEGIVEHMTNLGVSEIPFVAESRGTSEDNQLSAAFLRILRGLRSPDASHPVRPSLCFRRKTDNIAGLQMADLAAYPFARHLLGSDQGRESIRILEPKLHTGGLIPGIRVFL
jgi:hypothetical protein